MKPHPMRAHPTINLRYAQSKSFHRYYDIAPASALSRVMSIIFPKTFDSHISAYVTALIRPLVNA